MSTSNDGTIEVRRDYSSIYAIKDFARNFIMPDYFDSGETNFYNIGLIGYVTEMIANSTEDSFNVTSTLMKEVYPNKAQMPESLYNYLALYKMGDMFAVPSTINIILAVNETELKSLSTRKTGDDFKEFILDGDTIINIEGYPYMLDYDIKIKHTVRNGNMVFTANYIREYEKSLTKDRKSVNIPIKRINQKSPEDPYGSKGTPYLILFVKVRQLTKFEHEHYIINNDKINLPTVNFIYNGQLAGFDVLYRNPGETDYMLLQKRLINSLPIKEPFCYYEFSDENKITISFSSRDNYFQPKFNSEMKIIYYTTLGEEANFERYDGNEIIVEPVGDRYPYNQNAVIIGGVHSGSIGGINTKSLEVVRDLVDEMFSTVGSYTTENDLDMYFSNFKHRYNTAANKRYNNVLFLKRRDDVLDRIFNAFMILRDKNGEVYNTNTLHLEMAPGIKEDNGSYDIEYDHINKWILKPGRIFLYDNKTDDLAKPLEHYRISDLDKPEVSAKIERNYGLVKEIIYDEVTPYGEQTINGEDYIEGDRLYLLNQTDPSKNGPYLVDCKNWIKVEDYRKYSKNSLKLNAWVYTNPFLITVTRNPSIIGFYMNYINKAHILDYTYINDRSLLQFIVNNIKITRDPLQDENKYKIQLYLLPNIFLAHPMVIKHEATGEIIDGGVLKVKIAFQNENGKENFFLDMKCIDYNEYADGLQEYLYEAYLETDDYVSVAKYVHMENLKDMKTGEIDDTALLPMVNCVASIYTFYHYSTEEENIPHEFTYMDDVKTHTLTNHYRTIDDPINFMLPINIIKSNLVYKNLGGDFNKYNMRLSLIPLMRASIVSEPDLYDYHYFMDNLTNIFGYIEDSVDRIENNFNIDAKFYNTFGKSRNFAVGERRETRLNRTNCNIHFRVKPKYGSDEDLLLKNMDMFIKDYIESINEKQYNGIKISNLITELENNFDEIDHLVFMTINDYPSPIQVIENQTDDLKTLTKYERQNYIPEFLNISYEDIKLSLIDY